MRRYDYVLWDWNGTLLDDLQMNLEIENCLLSRRGLQQFGSKEFYLKEFGFPIIDFYIKLGFDFTKESYADVADEYFAEYEKRLPSANLFHDALPVIDLLRKDGIKNVIISATENELLKKQVETFKIEDRFEMILGSEDNLGKSKVSVALDWMRQNNVDSTRTAFIGDTTHDFETARAIGCECFFVCRGHNSKQRLLETGCEVFDNLSEVYERLMKE